MVLVSIETGGKRSGEQRCAGAFDGFRRAKAIARFDEMHAAINAHPRIHLDSAVKPGPLLVTRTDVDKGVVGTQQLQIAIDPPPFGRTKNRAEQERVLVNLLGVNLGARTQGGRGAGSRGGG